MSAMSDYLENKLIDQIFRGQAFTFPATVYIGLLTAAPTDAGGGTEVTGGAYARASIGSSLANWAGTQGAGTTVASSGTSGNTSNNAVISYATPTASWGTVTHFGIYDALSGGNLLFWGTLTTAKTINIGDIVQFPAASLSFTLA
jgi:hypothetical protein